MKKDYDVTLRGHHLMAFYQLHFSEVDEAVLEALEAMFRFVLRVKYRYDGKHLKHMTKILRKIANSDVRVKIVDTLDDVCKKCRKYKRKEKLEKCGGIKDAEHDTEIAAHAGLMVGDIYSSKEILESLEMAQKNKLSIFYRQDLGFRERRGGDIETFKN